MIDENDIRWEDFSDEDRADMLRLRDAMLDFEDTIFTEELTLLHAITFKLTYKAEIMDYFQFGTYVEVIDFSYDTKGKALSSSEKEWLDILTKMFKRHRFSEVLETRVNTSHLSKLKDEVCKKIAKRNNISEGILSTDFFLDYDIAMLSD